MRAVWGSCDYHGIPNGSEAGCDGERLSGELSLQMSVKNSTEYLADSTEYLADSTEYLADSTEYLADSTEYLAEVLPLQLLIASMLIPLITQCDEWDNDLLCLRHGNHTVYMSSQSWYQNDYMAVLRVHHLSML